MIPRDTRGEEYDSQEHDHEIICSWDEEKESYKKKVSKIFFVLENEIKELEKRIEKLEGITDYLYKQVEKMRRALKRK